MITSSREKGVEAKQEGEANIDESKNFFKATPPSTSSSRQWSTFRNPRIVRVSRSFGGKDRHSKVCTIRGLRDRRIRLSVPTAIQLYDLQDRLGLSQPSKVIDWLLDATKNDIDNLPPLQIPQGFGQFHPHMLLPHDSTSSQSSLSPFFNSNLSFGMKLNSSSILNGEDGHNTMARSSKFNWEAEAEASLRGGANEVGNSICNNGKGKLIRTNEQENHNQDGLSAQRLFPVASTTHSSLPSLLNNNNNNNPMQFNPYNYHHHWDASNLSLSQFGFVPQAENNSLSLNTNNSSTSVSFSSAGGGGSQFFFCPPVTMPSLFPQYPPFAATPLETNEPREISHFHLLSSGPAHSQRNSNGRQPDKHHHN